MSSHDPILLEARLNRLESKLGDEILDLRDQVESLERTIAALLERVADLESDL